MDKETNTREILLKGVDTQNEMAKIQLRELPDALEFVLKANEVLKQLVIDAPEEVFEEANKLLKECDL